MEKGTPCPPELKEKVARFLREKWRSPFASLAIELWFGNKGEVIAELRNAPIQKLEEILAEYPREFPELIQIINNILPIKYAQQFAISDKPFNRLAQVAIPTAPKSIDISALPQLFEETQRGKDLEEEIFPEGPPQSDDVLQRPVYKRAQLLRQFRDLITYASAEKYTGKLDAEAMPEHQQAWFHQYRNLLRLILQKLKEENNPSLTEECLTILAISQPVCPSGKLQQALGVYERLNKQMAFTFEDRILELLRGLRNETVDFLAGPNIHDQEEWRHLIGKERGIAGAEMELPKRAYPLDKAKTLAAFDLFYTPLKIFRKIYTQKLDSQEVVQWFQTHVEKYKGKELADIWQEIFDPSGHLTVSSIFCMLEAMGVLEKGSGTNTSQLLIDGVMAFAMGIEDLGDDEANLQIGLWLSRHREYKALLNQYLRNTQRPRDAIQHFLTALQEKI